MEFVVLDNYLQVWIQQLEFSMALVLDLKLVQDDDPMIPRYFYFLVRTPPGLVLASSLVLVSNSAGLQYTLEGSFYYVVAGSSIFWKGKSIRKQSSCDGVQIWWTCTYGVLSKRGTPVCYLKKRWRVSCLVPVLPWNFPWLASFSQFDVTQREFSQGGIAHRKLEAFYAKLQLQPFAHLFCSMPPLSHPSFLASFLSHPYQKQIGGWNT